MKPRGEVFAFSIFTILGTLFFVFGLASGLQSIRQISTFARAQGSVVDVVTRVDSDGDTTYAPVVEFTAANGRRYEFTNSTSNNPSPYKIEQRVTVLYDPTNPINVRIDSPADLWILPFVFMLIGGIHGLIGWIGMFKNMRSRIRVA